MAVTISNNFTAVGNGPVIRVNRGDSITYTLSGTYAATLKLQASDNNGQSWTEELSTTGDVNSTWRNKGNADVIVRWRCSAFTSGTAETTLVSVDSLEASIEGGAIQISEESIALALPTSVTGALTVSSTIASGGVAVPTISSTSTLTNKTLTNPTVNAAGGVVVLPTAAAPAQTAEGSVVWDSNDDLLTVGDGTGRKTMVDTAGTQTLTNKTLTAPAISDPVLSGSATGTYTLAGTPTISSPAISSPAVTGGTFASAPVFTSAGFAGSSALVIGVDSTHGLIFKQIDEVLNLAALGATSLALTTPIPAGAVIISAQANVDTLVVAGGTTVKVGLGLAAGDVDKYGKTSDLTQNQKINTMVDWAVLSAPEAIAVTGVVADGSALGNSNITAGSVHVRIVYLELASLANA